VTSAPTPEMLHYLVAKAQAAYARCIDDLAGHGWPDFFDDECLYVVTTAENHREGLQAGLIYADSKGMLKDRIAALNEANIFERHSYRHILGQPLISRVEEDCIWAETAFMVARIMRTGETTLFATGRYLDCYVVAAGKVLIRERRVVCDSNRIDTLLAFPL
jgi:anthranilate 1,2-dioxygenase small subunit